MRKETAIWTVALILLGVLAIAILPLATAANEPGGQGQGKGPGIMARAGIRADLQQWRQAWTQYEAQRGRWQESKDAFLQARKQWQTQMAHDGLGKGLKGNWTNDTSTAARNLLGNAANTMIANLDAWQARVEADPLLSNDTKALLNQTISAQLVKLDGILPRIASASTKDDFKELSKELQEIARDAVPKTKLVAAQMLGERVGFVSEKADEIGVTLGNLSAQLASKGYNTTAIDQLITDYDAKVALAQQKEQDARAKVDESKTGGNATESLDQARELYTEAHNTMKDARDILKSIVEQVRETTGKQGAKLGLVNPGKGKGEQGRPDDRGGPGGRNGTRNITDDIEGINLNGTPEAPVTGDDAPETLNESVAG